MPRETDLKASSQLSSHVPREKSRRRSGAGAKQPLLSVQPRDAQPRLTRSRATPEHGRHTGRWSEPAKHAT